MDQPHEAHFEFVRPDGEAIPAKRYQNPDGSVGGWIATSAHVHPSAYVEAGAIVGPDAQVLAGQTVRNGESIFRI